MKKEHYKDILELVKPHWVKFLVVALCTAGVAACTSAVAYLIKPALDQVFLAKDLAMLKLLTAGVIGLYLIKGLCSWANVYLGAVINQKTILALRRKIFGHLVESPISYFDKSKLGTLVSSVTNDVNQVGSSFSSVIVALFRDTFTIIGLIWVIFQREWHLALISVFILPFAFIPMIRFGRKLRSISYKRQRSLGELSSILQEGLAGAPVIKSFGTEEYEAVRFSQENAKYFSYQMKGIKIDTLMAPLMEFFAGIGIVAVMWYGGHKVIVGASTPGTFFSFITALIMLYEPIKRLSKVNNVFQNGIASLNRLKEIISVVPETKGESQRGSISGFSDNIVLRDVSFFYGNTPALKNVTLKIQKGQVVGIVGKSGSGKSTLVSILLGFYHVTEGQILIDGVDVRSIKKSALRRLFSLVSQDPFLFDDTIRNNIAYATPSCSEEMLVAAAKAAYAYDFIMKLPNGFDTRVGEDGVFLSGGQKQRICIARAFLKNAPILILDEATSSLDSSSEQQVKRAIENLMAGRTTIIIAHRFSTLEHADKIFVLSKGEIVEEGSLRELLSNKGVFRYLHDLQSCERKAGGGKFFVS